MKEAYKSRVYTDRPAYADLDAPDKFQAIQGIICTHLKRHPKAICSYSGGSDSDILIHLIESTRELFPSLLPVKVVKAAWNIFGKSYEYRAKYNTYKAQRNMSKKIGETQLTLEEINNV